MRGAHHLDQDRIDYVDPGGLCTSDDLINPSPATTFAHLDSTVVLSRDIAAKVFTRATRWTNVASARSADYWYRALRSRSWRAVSAAALQRAQRYHRDFGMDELSEEDKMTVARARKIERFPSRHSTLLKYLPVRLASTYRLRTRSQALGHLSGRI